MSKLALCTTLLISRHLGQPAPQHCLFAYYIKAPCTTCARGGAHVAYEDYGVAARGHARAVYDSRIYQLFKGAAS
jgi:hypothetical protein